MQSGASQEHLEWHPGVFSPRMLLVTCMGGKPQEKANVNSARMLENLEREKRRMWYDPNGTRTRVSGVRGQRPRPLDDGAKLPKRLRVYQKLRSKANFLIPPNHSISLVHCGSMVFPCDEIGRVPAAIEV